jgi:aminoglycoside phosphotransferase (APT) family kinase protein
MGNSDIPSIDIRIATMLRIAAAALAWGDISDIRRLGGGGSNTSVAVTYRQPRSTRVDKAVCRFRFANPLGSLSLTQEFEVHSELHRLGLPVPRPLAFFKATEAGDVEFYVMEYLEGLFNSWDIFAAARHVSAATVGYRVGETLGLLHRRAIPARFTQLGLPMAVDVKAIGQFYGEVLETTGLWRDVGKAVAALNDADESLAVIALCHGDFRWGNLFVGADEIKIIDFEFAGLSDPASDLAWFLAPNWWLYAADKSAADTARAAAMEGYAAAAPRMIDPQRFRHWSIIANLRLMWISQRRLGFATDDDEIAFVRNEATVCQASLSSLL